MRKSLSETLDELLDRLGLIARGRKIGYELEARLIDSTCRLFHLA